MKIAGKTLKTTALVVLLFIMVIMAFAYFGDAEAAEPKNDHLYISVGPTLLSGEFSEGAFLQLTQRWSEKWEIGFGYVSPQIGKLSTGREFIKQNIFVMAGRVIHGPDVYALRRMHLGIGISAWQNTSRVSSGVMNYCLKLGSDLEALGLDTFSLVAIHCSNAGSGGPPGGGWNVGQDQLVLEWRIN